MDGPRRDCRNAGPGLRLTSSTPAVPWGPCALPRRGRTGPGTAALEQDRAYFALALAYRVGHRGLRHAQGQRGCGEAATVLYGQQQPEVLRAQQLRAAAGVPDGHQARICGHS
jgi:hypothetical protein